LKTSLDSESYHSHIHSTCQFLYWICLLSAGEEKWTSTLVLGGNRTDTPGERFAD
jgi:hypothetical protein